MTQISFYGILTNSKPQMGIVMQEKWKVASGYEVRYSVSTYGNVRDDLNNKPVSKVITGPEGSRYYYVNLQLPGMKRKLVKVARLVALTFIPNPEDSPVVDHKDRNKLNDNVNNLRWTTSKGNSFNQDRAITYDGEFIKDLVKNDFPEHQHTSAYAWMTLNRHLGEYPKLVLLYREFKRLQEWPERTCEITTPLKYTALSIEHDGVWYPTALVFCNTHSLSDKQWELFREGQSLEEVKKYDPSNRFKITVGGFTGTKEEIYHHFNITESTVGTRINNGMTFEEAVLSQHIKKIKHYLYQDKVWVARVLIESFGLNAKAVNKYKYRRQCSLAEALRSFGVNISDEELIPTLKPPTK